MEDDRNDDLEEQQDAENVSSEADDDVTTEGEKKSSSSFNPLVNAVTFLTGGPNRRDSKGPSKVCNSCSQNAMERQVLN